MKPKSRNIIIIAGALVAGYVAGIIIDIPKGTGNLSSGDISKVSKYHKKTVDSKETSSLEEKLKSDTLAFNEELVTIGLIDSRVNDFATLVDYSIIVAADKEEFCEEINSLISVKELSENAIQASKIASASLGNIASGETNEFVTDYEQASQNMVVAFLMVDRQVMLGKQFVDVADKYLENNSKEDYPEIALARDLWAEYCAESAYLNEDKKELAYWDGQKRLCNMDMLGRCERLMPIIGKNFESSIFAHNMTCKALLRKFNQENFSNLVHILGYAHKGPFTIINAMESSLESKSGPSLAGYDRQELASCIKVSEIALNITGRMRALNCADTYKFQIAGYLQNNNIIGLRRIEQTLDSHYSFPLD